MPPLLLLEYHLPREEGRHGELSRNLEAQFLGLCHHVGYKNFDNTATNLRFLALLTGGEGLHNNHHGYPRSPKFSFRASEIDPAWPIIKLLIALHLAKPYKTIDEIAA